MGKKVCHSGKSCIKFSLSDTISGDMSHSGYVGKSHWHTLSDKFSLSDTTFQRQKCVTQGMSTVVIFSEIMVKQAAFLIQNWMEKLML